jgi:hypothetical protein
MAASLTPLSELIAGWPADGPQYGSELLDADPDDLSTVERELRRHLVGALNSSRDITFGGPDEVRTNLERGYLHLEPGRWVTYALDARRRKIVVARAGGTGVARWVSNRVPDAGTLADRLPLQPGSVYLVCYAGSPDILAVRDRSGGGVADDLAALRVGQSNSPFSDVIFWHRNAVGGPAFYSLRSQCGEQGRGRVIQFPKPEWVTAALTGRLHHGDSASPSPLKGAHA